MISFWNILCVCSPYNLVSALYAETEYNKYSTVVVLVKTDSNFERFENLRNSKACFAEHRGIGNKKKKLMK